MDKSLLEIIVCPSCHGKLDFIKAVDQKESKLICKFDRLAFNIDDGIPVLLAEKAEVLTQEKVEQLMASA